VYRKVKGFGSNLRMCLIRPCGVFGFNRKLGRQSV